MVVDYQNGKIYKLWSPSNDLVYIGSTTQNLSMRKGGHVVAFKNWQNGKRNFITSFTILECEDNRIDLLEAYPCNNKSELLAREGYWIKKSNCVNKRIAGRTVKEYYVDNKKEIIKKKKAYYVDNKEKINEYKKEYNIKNKEELSKKKKEYHENNKEKIKKYKQVRCSCSCGSNFRQDKISNHIKTEKHQNFLNSSKQVVIILVG